MGQLVATPAAIRQIPQPEIIRALERHLAGDWGDVDSEDRLTNNRALIVGSRIFSVYHGSDGTKFWIITESDRSVTTVLLPEDY